MYVWSKVSFLEFPSEELAEAYDTVESSLLSVLTTSSCRKFGKHIQKRQLEIPEYAASLVDYKALKKLIKQLCGFPAAHALDDAPASCPDIHAIQEANKATFFFRLERELEKVNSLYLQKEADLKLRLKSLLAQKQCMQSQQTPASRLSSRYIALEEGFRHFSSDLSKLQQFIEVNATAFAKILKKWDKASKSETKVIFLSRAVEVQPCFNPDVLSNLSDQATFNLLDFAAWAEGDRVHPVIISDEKLDASARSLSDDDWSVDSQILQAMAAGNTAVIQDWAERVQSLPDARSRITRTFFSSADDAPLASLQLLLNTGMVHLEETDDVNGRNILHKAVISRRSLLLEVGLKANVHLEAADIYGRIPLHYACIHGADDMLRILIRAGPKTVNSMDHESFTPLIYSIVHERLDCMNILLSANAQINPISEQDHVPLNLACQHGSIQSVKLLLSKRPDILPDAEGLYPQHLVARSSKAPELLSMLHDYGANLDQSDNLYQWTPLFHAASEGNVACLKALLDCGVNINLLDEKGLSALYYATWEGHVNCIELLAEMDRLQNKMDHETASQENSRQSNTLPPSIPSKDYDAILPLKLPPPILPVRRYGHSFLESKTFVVIQFGTLGIPSIEFYEDNAYSAARIAITSKSSDLIPRNLQLPIQEEEKMISFQIDNLDTFSIEFDVYPTFGARVIARAVASSKVFECERSSSKDWHLELLDPRLRAIGRISFSFQIVQPFSGTPLEISHFATYWRDQSSESHPTPLITGSSLSGDYVRLYVQLTCDNIPVLYPQWKVNHYGLHVPVLQLDWSLFCDVGEGYNRRDVDSVMRTPLMLDSFSADDLPSIHHILAHSFSSLGDALELLPPNVKVELHVLYPNRVEEEGLRLGPTPDINRFADALLKVVFDHARMGRQKHDGYMRGIVFSSSNPDICTALNWKQPNYPVLLCSNLGLESPGGLHTHCRLSIKEAVSLSKSNNLMGLVCRSDMLDLAPALVNAIKGAGLVLISDDSKALKTTASKKLSKHVVPPETIDGILHANGVVQFYDCVDVG